MVMAVMVVVEVGVAVEVEVVGLVVEVVMEESTIAGSALQLLALTPGEARMWMVLAVAV